MVELLVVTTMIAIMASVLLFIINPATQFQKGRDTRRKADLSQIQGPLEFYRSDYGYYPVASYFSTCNTAFTVGSTTYLAKIPCDPLAPGTTPYRYKPTRVSDATTTCTTGCDNLTPSTQCVKYCLVACLEIVTDPDKDQANDSAVCNGTTRWSKTVKNL
ncbi:MAG: type II secretion system protein [Candidatus Levybacteria bacterium]|nr:type II secretion system protein [Candidatus Levybacteria bacterium]